MNNPLWITFILSQFHRITFSCEMSVILFFSLLWPPCERIVTFSIILPWRIDHRCNSPQRGSMNDYRELLHMYKLPPSYLSVRHARSGKWAICHHTHTGETRDRAGQALQAGRADASKAPSVESSWASSAAASRCSLQTLSCVTLRV